MKTLFLFLVLAVAPQMWADDLVISLDAQTQPIYPGSTVTFTGKVTNLDDMIVDLNSISVTISGDIATDPTDFFYGPLTVDPLATTSDYAMFTAVVDFPYSDAYGDVLGVFSILGAAEISGYDPTTQSYLGSQTFAINVQPAPEPQTSALLLLALPFIIRRARVKAKQFGPSS